MIDVDSLSDIEQGAVPITRPRTVSPDRLIVTNLYNAIFAALDVLTGNRKTIMSSRIPRFFHNANVGPDYPRVLTNL
ncbi:MAG TPA: hypothetical protein EYQ30_03785 [Gammaproteobacteria bacterium]|nr:hypothetical protein [Gammaproteobacteria bacterium]